jgi:hypothetical protein
VRVCVCVCVFGMPGAGIVSSVHGASAAPCKRFLQTMHWRFLLPSDHCEPA